MSATAHAPGSPADVVTRFCAAFASIDPDEIVGFMTPDAVYHNIPIDPAVGHDAIRAMLTMFTSMATGIEFRITQLAVDGNVVLTERVDVFHTPDGKVIELPVMGTFEVTADGKISAWRDYFDLNQFMSRMQG